MQASGGQGASRQRHVDGLQGEARLHLLRLERFAFGGDLLGQGGDGFVDARAVGGALFGGQGADAAPQFVQPFVPAQIFGLDGGQFCDAVNGGQGGLRLFELLGDAIRHGSPPSPDTTRRPTFRTLR